MSFKILNNLKSIRARNNMSQAEIASLLGISRQYYLLKENGAKNFNQIEIEKLMSLFELPYNSIFFTQDANKTVAV